ncbi:hypothetical protein Pcinc_005716 [Petrolisthes cinctipes]|uniref:Uncharacterized protein n=1 Tax=Petrolisthes cinctipes TaxID=88211 RepID=A0AAE1GC34_PETCI|nr:hypothetical protein Pcinc_005716 [Petrolisthes cinctipes]
MASEDLFTQQIEGSNTLSVEVEGEEWSIVLTTTIPTTTTTEAIVHAPPVPASSRKGRGKGRGLGKKMVRMEPPNQAEKEVALDDPDFFDEEEEENDPLSQVVGKRRRRAGSQMSSSQEVEAATWYAKNEISYNKRLADYKNTAKKFQIIQQKAGVMEINRE